jgi:hypothetical protein
MRLLFTLIAAFLVAPVAAQQPIIGEEVSSTPLDVTLRRSQPPVALARDARGTVIAWLAGDSRGLGRVHVARIGFDHQIDGTVRVLPVVSNDRDVTQISMASSAGSVVVTWNEIAPNNPAIQAIAYARLDANLVAAPPIQLFEFEQPGKPFIRATPDGFWLAAGKSLWHVSADGSHGPMISPGLAAEDLAVSDGNAQIVGYQTTPKPICTGCGDRHSWCTCPPPDAGKTRIALVTVFVRAGQLPYLFDQAPPAWVRNHDGESIVVWHDNDSIRVVKLTSALEPDSSSLRTVGIASRGNATQADLASDGKRWVIVWNTVAPGGDYDIVGTSLEPDGSLVPLTIATSTAHEFQPSIIATGPGEFLVAYRKQNVGEQRIAGRAITFPERRRAVH